MARELRIKVTVENAQAKAELKEVERGIGGVEEASNKSAKALEALTGEAATRQMRQLAGDITAAVKDLTGAFAEEQAALVSLQTALKAQGQATPAVIAQYKALGEQFQNTTAFSDDLIFQMEALLVQVGNVMPAQMEAALQASTNLAAGLGIDLRTATMLVGKAFEGETGTLKRYGIVVDETKLKSDGVGAVLEAINSKFGGQAQSQLETYTGKMEQMGNKVSDAKEKLGGLLVDALIPIINAFTALPQPVQSFILVVGALGVALAPIAVTLATLIPLLSAAMPAAIAALVTAGGGLVTLFATTLPAAFSAILPFLGPAGLIAAGVIAVVVAWKNWDAIVEFFKGAWQYVKSMLLQTPDWLAGLLGPIGLVVIAFKHWDQITAIVKNVYLAVKEWLVDKFTAIVASVKAKVDAVTGFFKGMYDSVVGNSYVPDMMIRIEEEFGRLGAIMVDPTASACVMTTDAFGAMAATVTDQIDKWTSGLQSKLTQFMGGENSLLGNILKNGLAAMLGPAGPLASLISKGIQKLGELAIAAAKKMWEGIQSIFGTDEEARKVNPARDKFLSQFGPPGTGPESGFQQLAAMLTNITGEDGGGSLFRAMTAADTMSRFRSAAEAIVSALNAAGIAASINFHRGGMVPGLGEIPARLMGGEGVLTAQGVSAAGGPAGVAALNSGVSMSGVEQRLDKLTKRFDEWSDRIVQRNTTNMLHMKYASLMPRS